MRKFHTSGGSLPRSKSRIQEISTSLDLSRYAESCAIFGLAMRLFLVETSAVDKLWFVCPEPAYKFFFVYRTRCLRTIKYEIHCCPFTSAVICVEYASLSEKNNQTKHEVHHSPLTLYSKVIESKEPSAKCWPSKSSKGRFNRPFSFSIAFIFFILFSFPKFGSCN